MPTVKEVLEKEGRRAWECLRDMWCEANRIHNNEGVDPLPARVKFCIWAAAYGSLSEDDFELILNYWEQKIAAANRVGKAEILHNSQP